jgi:hypothetical protein
MKRENFDQSKRQDKSAAAAAERTLSGKEHS